MDREQSDKRREAFERYAVEQGCKDFEQNEFGDYRNLHTNSSWHFWKAGQDALLARSASEDSGRPYGYEFIKGKDGQCGHFRIHDFADNAVGFCYSEFNAQHLVRALNGETQSSMGEPMSDEEARLLHDVLNLARETLFIGIKGSPEELQRSLGRLNLACKAHWDWQTGRYIRRGAK